MAIQRYTGRFCRLHPATAAAASSAAAVGPAHHTNAHVLQRVVVLNCLLCSLKLFVVFTEIGKQAHNAAAQTRRHTPDPGPVEAAVSFTNMCSEREMGLTAWAPGAQLARSSYVAGGVLAASAGRVHHVRKPKGKHGRIVSIAAREAL